MPSPAASSKTCSSARQAWCLSTASFGTRSRWLRLLLRRRHFRHHDCLPTRPSRPRHLPPQFRLLRIIKTPRIAFRCPVWPTMVSTLAPMRSLAPRPRSGQVVSLCDASWTKSGAHRLAFRTLPRQIRRKIHPTQTPHKHPTTPPTNPRVWRLLFLATRPPHQSNASSTTAAASLRRQRERLGDLENYEAPRKTDRQQWEFDTAGAIGGTDALLDAMGENNPILQDLLKTAKDEIVRATGRRLMQRIEYNTKMTDVLITHEIMTFYGTRFTLEPTFIRIVQPALFFLRPGVGGIPGISSGSCEALCEATKQDNDAKRTDECNAFAFKRAMPHSFVDQTGWCYLLQVPPFVDVLKQATLLTHCFFSFAECRSLQVGGFWCANAFNHSLPTLTLPPTPNPCANPQPGTELFTRQIESERQCVAAAPGLDSERKPLHQLLAPVACPLSNVPSFPRQIRCALVSRRRATMRGCFHTPMPPRRLTRCRTTAILRRAVADFHSRDRLWRPCPCWHSVLAV